MDRRTSFVRVPRRTPGDNFGSNTFVPAVCIFIGENVLLWCEQSFVQQQFCACTWSGARSSD